MSENLFVICFLHKVWLLDIRQGIYDIYISRKGFSDPLNLCCDGSNVYWGDYGNNPVREEVNIYRFTQQLKVETAYTFSKGTIGHIHNIIYDKRQECFWILTGDNNAEPGIYWANKNFSEVVPFKTGEQKYRAVVAFPYHDGLIYATDAVDEENHIRIISTDGTETIVTDMNGSCIYGTETKDYFVFSTTVEPPPGRGWNMITYKLGEGIKSREAFVVAVNKATLKVKIIAKLRKDILPMKLFQYGVAKFPIGQEHSDTLHYRIIACKGDGKLITTKID